MIKLNHCPCCEAPVGRHYPAVLAPFIRERLGPSAPLTTTLAECERCGFRFFGDRYEPGEAAAIYAGYRDERYFKQRHRHELWYTRSLNQALGSDEEASRRNSRLEAFLKDAGVLPQARSVLDWGGDRGQFIPGCFTEKFVHDISGVAPDPGVTAVGADRVRSRSYDLVIAAHVIEHASDPGAVVRELRSIDASWWYVEVPFEPLRLLRRLQESRLQRLWVERAARSQIYSIVALMSAVARVKGRALPPMGILQQHEHLNYFDAETLRKLLERAGFRVVRITEWASGRWLRRVEAIGVLAVPSR